MTCKHGPLRGLKVIELGSISPTAFAGMHLADLGADVVRIERPDDRASEGTSASGAVQDRGKRVASLDLKQPDNLRLALELIDGADILLEGFRPGVVERLGIGPSECLSRNPRLIYGRLTGWGQNGPLSAMASHDPNNLAIVGALHAIGRRDGPPQLPLALVGDLGGGALYLTTGVLAALHERDQSGLGQVIDAAIVDGVAHMMASVYGAFGAGNWIDERGANLTDSGTPFIDVYETADGAYMSVAALEAKFYGRLLEGLGLDGNQLPDRWDRHQWPNLQTKLAEAFASKTQAEWTEVFTDLDACVAPVLSLSSAPNHPHLRQRQTFFERDGRQEPWPAPRFSRTRPPRPSAGVAGVDLWAVAAEWGDRSTSREDAEPVNRPQAYETAEDLGDSWSGAK